MSDQALQEAVGRLGGVTPAMAADLAAFTDTVRSSLAGFPLDSMHPVVGFFDQIHDLLDAVATVENPEHCHLPEVGRLLHARGGLPLLRSSRDLIRIWIGPVAAAYLDAAWGGLVEETPDHP